MSLTEWRQFEKHTTRHGEGKFKTHIRDVDVEAGCVREIVGNDLVVVQLEAEGIVEVDDGLGAMVWTRLGRRRDIGVDAVNFFHLALGLAGNTEPRDAVDTEAGSSFGSGRHDARGVK